MGLGSSTPDTNNDNSNNNNDTTNLEGKSVAELKEIAEGLGVFATTSDREELIQLISAQQLSNIIKEPNVTSSSSSQHNSNNNNSNNNSAPAASMSKWKMITTAYEDIVRAIIRPPRSTYSIKDLGKPEFRLNGLPFKRKDFQITNDRNQLIECSWWAPLGEVRGVDFEDCFHKKHNKTNVFFFFFYRTF